MLLLEDKSLLLNFTNDFLLKTLKQSTLKVTYASEILHDLLRLKKLLKTLLYATLTLLSLVCE